VPPFRIFLQNPQNIMDSPVFWRIRTPCLTTATSCCCPYIIQSSSHPQVHMTRSIKRMSMVATMTVAAKRNEASPHPRQPGAAARLPGRWSEATRAIEETLGASTYPCCPAERGVGVYGGAVALVHGTASSTLSCPFTAAARRVGAHGWPPSWCRTAGIRPRCRAPCESRRPSPPHCRPAQRSR
jgi:hypothetical protein